MNNSTEISFNGCALNITPISLKPNNYNDPKSSITFADHLGLEVSLLSDFTVAYVRAIVLQESFNIREKPAEKPF